MNFIRSSVASGRVVTEAALLDGSESGWKDEKYLIPFLENDGLLMELDEAFGIDFEDNAGGACSEEENAAAQLERLAEENEALKRTVRELRESLEVAGNFLKQDDDDDDDDGRRAATEKLKNVKIDKNYFDSYSGLGIHREMLSDAPRMAAYRSALESNSASLVSGKRVLDVGFGTGILSMLAARAGAAEVCAVDGSSAIAALAQEIVAENKLGQKVVVRSGLIEEEKTLGDQYRCGRPRL